MRQIYLDYNATTPIAPAVLDAMQPFLHRHYGNSHSSHLLGRAAHEGIEDSRAKVAGLLGCDSEEVVFTSGGTESNNLALKGVMFKGQGKARGHLIISAVEHAAVTNPARFLEQLGYDLTIVGCDENGRVSPSEIEKAIRPKTKLVSIMHANNEVGTVQPLEAIGEVCRSRGVLFHTDAAQSVGKISTFVEDLKVDLLTVAGHKLYGPKGVGALYVRRGVNLEPLFHGASHEWGIRSGTLNTAGIVGLGHACQLALLQLDETAMRMSELRDRLERVLMAEIPGLIVNAQNVSRLPNTSSVTFPGVSGQELLKRIPELCASLGTACHHEGASSSTLAAMGRSREHATSTIRLSLGWQTTPDEIDRAASLLIDAWEQC